MNHKFLIKQEINESWWKGKQNFVKAVEDDFSFFTFSLRRHQKNFFNN